MNHIESNVVKYKDRMYEINEEKTIPDHDHYETNKYTLLS